MLSAGSLLDGYRIERILGSGGMGAVYLAANPTLPRRDALKVLSAELSRDLDFRTRFHREADVAAGLDHPNIVSVYTRGETADGQLWIAMQFVDGTDADAALRAGTMTPPRAVHIIGEVARALDYAHAHGVVHRDIKPANFMLSGPAGPDERVLLGDFGIARALDDVGLTATGSVLATVAYAAPEVLSGVAFDGRADIYSLGCALYALLTGAVPYPATNGMASVMMAHLQRPAPRVTDTVPSLPAALDQVIATAMAKDPAARFTSAGALAAAAYDALYNPTKPLTLPTPPRRAPQTRRRIVVAAAGAAVVVAGGSLLALNTGHGPAPAPRTTAAAQHDVAEVPVQDSRPSATPPPATDVAPAALRSILLTANEIPGNVGVDRIALESDGTALLDDSTGIDDADCLGAWAPAQHRSYDGSQFTGAAVQSLRGVRQKISDDGVVQAVLSFPSRQQAVAVLQRQQRQWEMCADRAVAISIDGAPAQPWHFGRSAMSGGAVRIDISEQDGTATCQHGIGLRGNVLIDIRQCRPEGTVNVAALVSATAAKVPRQ